jgi:hypothetical protein
MILVLTASLVLQTAAGQAPLVGDSERGLIRDSHQRALAVQR